MRVTFFLLLSILCFSVQAQIPKTTFSTYSVDATQCTVLAHEQSRIYIPKYCFSLKGKAYEGMVNIYYRQFTDALDIVINALPMQYATPQGEKTLESAGMFELYALATSGDTLQFLPNKNIMVRLYSPWDKKGMESFYLSPSGWQKNTLFASSPSANISTPDDERQLWDDDIWRNYGNDEDISTANTTPVAINYESITDRNFKTLNIDKFGMYNFDKIADEESIPIYANFKVNTSKNFLSTMVYVIYNHLNTVFYYVPGNNDPLLLLKNQPFSIVSFANDGSIAKVEDSFLLGKDFSAYSGKEITFPMTKISQKIDTKEELAQILVK